MKSIAETAAEFSPTVSGLYIRAATSQKTNPRPEAMAELRISAYPSRKSGMRVWL
jgi:hypothetical protein